ncbi:cytochrome c oxidase subunit 1 [Sphingopyxis sp. EG6]|nr:cytochrome c oxidase subunit 1 [Sphingopyxis sp. EG6]
MAVGGGVGAAMAGGAAGGVWLAPISTGAASIAVQNIDRLNRWVIAGIPSMFFCVYFDAIYASSGLAASETPR